MQKSFQHLLVDQAEGVLTVAFNRPEVRNAVNDRMLEELAEVLEEAAADAAVRCVVLTGAGGAFGSGQDLRAFEARAAGERRGRVSEHLQKYHRVIRCIREMQKPVIAAVRGVAAGASCSLALACDLRIASENARFLQAFARIGLIPDAGGGFFLTRLVGLGKALELAMLADEVSGPEAERLGLVNRCVPDAEFEEATRALARRLAQGPTRAYGLIKQLLNTAVNSDLETVLRLEGELQEVAIETADHREGVAAFREKRPPRYSGQ
ncbi:MAG: enoyl-CoA hydratase/isomerase family protein [Thermogemmatispora sp.]|jgi:2-(1,2-epoxy-1,2-dihydrophenyl)acetyl-CoA isomerase|uniref:Enoyl-CoA hydratase n=1 Tax=Thermogemmatispora aurantia TaxID=2045279 RepID=A0A5J4K696_9CHLR|nr:MULTISPECIES: enoyl-CoA hydratase-related protein [Thermogemmatispora]MBE3565529.1 enoyl-CoA hydratase/isomerase family protein [Thermogemmatispora sp.]GER81666.1 enoyl-CoA hydratase [Thermogemmatispora aurantia]